MQLRSYALELHQLVLASGPKGCYFTAQLLEAEGFAKNKKLQRADTCWKTADPSFSNAARCAS